MKKNVFLVGLMIILCISSCSFETYHQCPAYSQTVKTTKYGAKAQAKYIKKHKL